MANLCFAVLESAVWFEVDHDDPLYWYRQPVEVFANAATRFPDDDPDGTNSDNPNAVVVRVYTWLPTRVVPGRTVAGPMVVSKFTFIEWDTEFCGTIAEPMADFL